MTKAEYDHLQERFSRLLNGKCGDYIGGNKREAYREGVLAAKSVLHEEYTRYMKEDAENG